MLKHIYDKTDKGREEIATRKYHLAARLRALLVMIDGHRPLEVLMKNFGALGLSQDHVTELLGEGFLILVDAGEPEAVPEPLTATPRVAVSARARMVARRAASAHAHHEHHGDAGHQADRAHVVEAGDQETATGQLHQTGGTVATAPQLSAVAPAAVPAAAGMSEADTNLAVREFYTQTIRSTLGLRGMMLQLKVEKCANMAELSQLRDVYLEAVLKAKGREMALSLSGRLDQLLGSVDTSRAA